MVHGEPGVGKSALLVYLAGRAAGCRVVRAAGVESEMELAFAGLHQLLAPVLDRVEGLPGPQREALRTAFGLSAGPVPDRFLVGLAVLGLVSEVAGERPLVCVVDDEQWLDRASVQALGFAARRLAADPVGLVFAARVTGAELAGLPELAVEGLGEEDARALLDSVLTGPVDARVRDLIVAETRGNPLALLELPRGMAPAELAGGFGLPEAGPLPGRIEDSFRRQLEGLPEQTRRLLAVAAADPSGDPLLVWRAAGRLGIPVQAGAPAVREGLVQFGQRVWFWHPLARSAAYRSAPVRQMQQIHAALAEVTDPAADPDRRAWHRAQATPGPDEDVAAELERSAGRAQDRGGLAAAAAFLERAALLTPESGRRAARLLAAARVKREAGELDAALGLLVPAEAGPLDARQGAEAERLRGQIAFDQTRAGDAARLLVSAARRLDPVGADNVVTSRDLRILVDQATQPIASSDAYVVAGGCDVGPAVGWSLAEGPVRTVGVVVIDVFAEGVVEMPPAGDEDSVSALAPGTGDPPFADRVRSRRPDRRGDDPRAGRSEDRVERVGVLGIAVPDQELQAAGLFAIRSMIRLRACCVVQSPVGYSVTPRMRIRRIACPITVRTWAWVPLSMLTVKKSQARIASAWERRNCDQVGPVRRGAGSMPLVLRISHTVDAATLTPRPASSPWILR